MRHPAGTCQPPEFSAATGEGRRPVGIKGWRLALLAVVTTATLRAEVNRPYQSKPAGHAANRELARTAYETNRLKYRERPEVLVLPGLVADRTRRRVEIMVERSAVGPEAACEFLVVGESSDHAYEALLIAFAEPSHVHQALEFIGTPPGASFDPERLRFWPKGESFVLSLLRSNTPSLRIESLLMDRRTGRALPEQGFLFTGSRWVASVDDPLRMVYAADVYQPKALVSLFNTTYSVLEVSHRSPKDVVYQNTTVNPEHILREGALETLLLEPATAAGIKRVQDLTLKVAAVGGAVAPTQSDLDRLKGLELQLFDGPVCLNEAKDLISLVERLAGLNRRDHDPFLTVKFDERIELGQARALSRILSSLDGEQGIRIEPPPAGQLYYRAFTPDQELLDREARIFHPWELVISEQEGRISGKLLRCRSVFRKDATPSELEISEILVASPPALQNAFEAEAKRGNAAGEGRIPPVLMVFAPSSLRYGPFLDFLEPVLATHKSIHVFLDQQPPPVSKRNPSL